RRENRRQENQPRDHYERQKREGDAVTHQQNEENHEADAEFYESRSDGCGGNQDAREINLRDQMRASDDAVAGGRHSIREEQPRQKTGEGEDRIRNSVAGNLRKS